MVNVRRSEQAIMTIPVACGMTARAIAALAATCLPLAGCTRVGAPSHVVLGAYFPSWLLFALLWAGLAVAVRVALALTSTATPWPWPLALCAAAGFLLALGSWLAIAGALP